jgi:hypothetical protein
MGYGNVDNIHAFMMMNSMRVEYICVLRRLCNLVDI